MFPARPVKYLELKFGEAFQPTPLLTNGLRRALQPLQSSMVRPQDERASQQILPVRLSEMHHR
jgi:hypothetical protein